MIEALRKNTPNYGAELDAGALMKVSMILTIQLGKMNDSEEKEALVKLRATINEAVK